MGHEEVKAAKFTTTKEETLGYFCAQSQTRILIKFAETGRLRVESQGLLFRSWKLGRFDFPMTLLSDPGSPRIGSTRSLVPSQGSFHSTVL